MSAGGAQAAHAGAAAAGGAGGAAHGADAAAPAYATPAGAAAAGAGASGSAALKDKALGAMFGMAVGDWVGACVEFSVPGSFKCVLLPLHTAAARGACVHACYIMLARAASWWHARHHDGVCGITHARSRV
jgi:hypothetical protein